jgi:hypothetical protein
MRKHPGHPARIILGVTPSASIPDLHFIIRLGSTLNSLNEHNSTFSPIRTDLLQTKAPSKWKLHDGEQEKAVRHAESAKGNATKSIHHAQVVIGTISNAKWSLKIHCQDLDSANDTRAYPRRQPPVKP